MVSGVNSEHYHHQNYLEHQRNALAVNQNHQEQDQNIVNKMNNEIKNIRQQLPLDVIQERQSEFS